MAYLLQAAWIKLGFVDDLDGDLRKTRKTRCFSKWIFLEGTRRCDAWVWMLTHSYNKRFLFWGVLY